MVFAYALAQILIVQLIFLPLTYFTGKKIGKNTGWITTIPLLYSLILLGNVALEVNLNAVYEETYAWAPTIGLVFGLKADGLSIWVLMTINLLCLFVSIYSIPYMKHRFQEWEHERVESQENNNYANYYTLYLSYALGMLGAVMATNLIQFYLFYELMLVPSWLLINNYGYGERERIGMMYFMWTHVGAVIMLLGLLTSYQVTGSFEITKLALLVNHPVAKWVAFAILIGFFTKMAVFGIHIWLPYAHGEAPTPISALLSPAMIGIGAYAAIRLVAIPLSPVFSSYSRIFSLWALITMVYGGLMALSQDDIKRFLAYSSISQMGYLFLGLASASALGEAGAIFHYVSHGLGKCILFCVAGILLTQTGTRSIKKMGGLAQKMPWTTVFALIGFFCISGVPPTIGFMSKFMIFSGVFGNAIETSIDLLVISIISIIMAVLTVGYSLWTIQRIFFGPLEANLNNVKDAPSLMMLPLIAFSILAIILGIYPKLVTDFLIPFFTNNL